MLVDVQQARVTTFCREGDVTPPFQPGRSRIKEDTAISPSVSNKALMKIDSSLFQAA
jgi:hypothetical protein